MNHRIGQSLFALAVGLAVAVFAYQWITDPAPREQRQVEERAVLASRDLLVSAVGVSSLEIIDPLAPNRKVGKVYIYAEEPGWAVSGYYRRDEDDRWHPYLLSMTADLELHALKTEDAALAITE
ncbi:MAG: hypothetical protein WBM57_14160 [Woeseiaceae bacterium]